MLKKELFTYSQQQNKWYRQKYVLTHFEATFYFSRSEFTYTQKHNHKLLYESKHLWGAPFILLLNVHLFITHKFTNFL